MGILVYLMRVKLWLNQCFTIRRSTYNLYCMLVWRERIRSEGIVVGRTSGLLRMIKRCNWKASDYLHVLAGPVSG